MSLNILPAVLNVLVVDNDVKLMIRQRLFWIIFKQKPKPTSCPSTVFRDSHYCVLLHCLTILHTPKEHFMQHKLLTSWLSITEIKETQAELKYCEGKFTQTTQPFVIYN